jgi:hypothetical protein
VENAQVHSAVDARADLWSITISPPLFRSFQEKVAARLLPAHLTTTAPTLGSHLGEVSPPSGGVGWSGPRWASRIETACSCRGAGAVEVAQPASGGQGSAWRTRAAGGSRTRLLRSEGAAVSLMVAGRSKASGDGAGR